MWPTANSAASHSDTPIATDWKSWSIRWPPRQRYPMPVATSPNGVSKIGTAYGIGKRYGARYAVNRRMASYANPRVATSTRRIGTRFPGAGECTASSGESSTRWRISRSLFITSSTEKTSQAHRARPEPMKVTGPRCQRNSAGGQTGQVQSNRQAHGTLPATTRLQRTSPRIHTHPQFEILTSRRGPATASGVSAAQTRSRKKAPRDRGALRLDFATTIEPAVILAGERAVDPTMASSVSWLDS